MLAKDWNSLRSLVIVQREVSTSRRNSQDLNFFRPQNAARWVAQSCVNELLLSLICIPNRDVRRLLRNNRQNISVNVPSESSAKTLKDYTFLKLALPVEDGHRPIGAGGCKIVCVGTALPDEQDLTRAVGLVVSEKNLRAKKIEKISFRFSRAIFAAFLTLSLLMFMQQLN